MTVQELRHFGISRSSSVQCEGHHRGSQHEKTPGGLQDPSPTDHRGAGVNLSGKLPVTVGLLTQAPGGSHGIKEVRQVPLATGAGLSTAAQYRGQANISKQTTGGWKETSCKL